ncbi:hypothetical protein [Lysinibacillus halotolerans]|uniref:Uncharacterized protein n=1 Tax=Lysinibacillus halotolerans TaxID=1368476 RepID=A0A3M8H800_9BACI|nr:hypothetical protein [Lysinibacillus halotolerans]RNC98220.1 hypothetical protein EC501_12070 [Lysinibacillus halotolerans]
MGNNGKVWLMIGGLIVVIGVAFSIFFSFVSEKQINQLVKSCENDGGEAIVTKHGFLVTTSYEFECKK